MVTSDDLSALVDAVAALDANIAALEENLAFERHLRARLVAIITRVRASRSEHRSEMQDGSDPFAIVTGPVERAVLRLVHDNPTLPYEEVAARVREQLR